jgi:dTDP-4-amino-4,6-dideoxygalactose transaminase
VEAALRALGVRAGDEVVLAAYEYESNLLTVLALGAGPVLVDVNPATWQLDPANLEAAITSRTKAVICSHLHGGIVPMSAVMEIARRRGVAVVDDAAQAVGATIEGRPAGTWGDVGVLSFGGSKLLCAGRGGALLFHDARLQQRTRVWLHRGLQQWAALSELQAAALRPQLRLLPEKTERRAANVRTLLAAVAVPGLVPLTTAAPDSKPAYYKLGFQYDPAAFGLSRDRFVAAMRAEGIAFDAGFNALHVGRSRSRFRAAGELTHAAEAHERCVILHHPVLSLSQADVLEVAEALAKTYRFRDALAERPIPGRGE